MTVYIISLFKVFFSLSVHIGTSLQNMFLFGMCVTRRLNALELYSLDIQTHIVKSTLELFISKFNQTSPLPILSNFTLYTYHIYSDHPVHLSHLYDLYGSPCTLLHCQIMRLNRGSGSKRSFIDSIKNSSI